MKYSHTFEIAICTIHEYTVQIVRDEPPLILILGGSASFTRKPRSPSSLVSPTVTRVSAQFAIAAAVRLVISSTLRQDFVFDLVCLCFYQP